MPRLSRLIVLASAVVALVGTNRVDAQRSPANTLTGQPPIVIGDMKMISLEPQMSAIAQNLLDAKQLKQSTVQKLLAGLQKTLP